MNGYIITFPGVWFDGVAIVYALNKEAALFYVKNKLDLPSHRTYRGLGKVLSDDDFVVTQIDEFPEGVVYFDSGSY